MKKTLFFLTITLGLVMNNSAQADNAVKKVGTYGSWHVYHYASKKGEKECFMTSSPSKSQGDYKKRGPVRIFITNRMSDKAYSEISFQAGYTYGNSSNVTLKIDQDTYQMPAKEQGAWLSSSVQDKEAVEKMINGKSMVIEGTSDRGTHTEDEFSLTGFTKAHQALNKTCAVQAIKTSEQSSPVQTDKATKASEPSKKSISSKALVSKKTSKVSGLKNPKKQK